MEFANFQFLLWNIVKEVSDPKSNLQWELQINENETTKDHQLIANTFNMFFSLLIINNSTTTTTTTTTTTHESSDIC